MKAIKDLNLLLSFLLELVMLFFYGYWGYKEGGTPTMSYLLAFLLPGVAIALWGTWAAPKSRRRLKNPSRSVLKISLGLLAASLSFLAGQPSWAFWFGAILLLNEGLAFIFKQDY